jgi:hypothetical protein
MRVRRIFNLTVSEGLAAYLAGVILVDRMGHGEGYPGVIMVKVDLTLR